MNTDEFERWNNRNILAIVGLVLDIVLLALLSGCAADLPRFHGM